MFGPVAAHVRNPTAVSPPKPDYGRAPMTEALAR